MSAGFSMAAMMRAASRSFSHVLRRLMMGTPDREGDTESRHNYNQQNYMYMYYQSKAHGEHFPHSTRLEHHCHITELKRIIYLQGVREGHLSDLAVHYGLFAGPARSSFVAAYRINGSQSELSWFAVEVPRTWECLENEERYYQ